MSIKACIFYPAQDPGYKHIQHSLCNFLAHIEMQVPLYNCNRRAPKEDIPKLHLKNRYVRTFSSLSIFPIWSA